MPADYSHRALINIRKALNHKLNLEVSDDGVCAGITQMTIQAFLCGQEEFHTFLRRLNYIVQHPDFFSGEPGKSQFEMTIGEILGKVADEREKIKSVYRANQKPIPKYIPVNLELSEEEQFVVDIRAMFDGVSLYLYPGLYSEEIGKTIAQDNIVEISEVVQSKKLQDLGGLRVPHKFMGVYYKEELNKLFKTVNQAANTCPSDFAISISSDNHRIAILYLAERRKWFFVDANNMPIFSIPLEKIGVQVLAAFEGLGGIKLKGAGTAFQAQLITTGRDEMDIIKMVENLEELPDFQELHALNQANLAKITPRRITVEWLAAKAGDNRLLVSSMRNNSKYLDMPSTAGIRPATVAVLRHNPKSLQVLVDAKNNGEFVVDLNKREGDRFGDTLLTLASKIKDIECMRILLDAETMTGEFRVDVNYENASGKSPVYILAAINFTKGLQFLIKARNDDGSFRSNLEIPDTEGRTPVYIATEYYHPEGLEMLLQARDNQGDLRVNPHIEVNGKNLAHLAVNNEDVKSLRILEENNLNFEKTVDGKSLKEIAAELKHNKVVKFYEAVELRRELITSVTELMENCDSKSQATEYESLIEKIQLTYKADHEELNKDSLVYKKFVKEIKAIQNPGLNLHRAAVRLFFGDKENLNPNKLPPESSNNPSLKSK